MSCKHCCVPQCPKIERSQAVLHQFPKPEKDIARFRTWRHAIGGEILRLSDQDIFKIRRVCHAHFEEKYHCRNNRISNIAVPTLFMPGTVKLNATAENLEMQECILPDKDDAVTPIPITERAVPAHNSCKNDHIGTVNLNATAENLEMQECTLQDKDDAVTPIPITVSPVPAHDNHKSDLIDAVILPITVRPVPTHGSCKSDHIGLGKMENFKMKLKNILHGTHYCGLCLEKDDIMSSVDADLEIIVNQQTRTKTLKSMIDVVFNEAANIPTSSFVCKSCTEKLMQSYIFIENAKETIKILDNCLNELLSTSDNIEQLPDPSKSTDVVIVLGNNELLEVKDKKDVFNVVEEKNEISQVEKKIARKRKYPGFECVKCTVCSKIFKNQQYLNAHYKVHSKVKCKFCEEILDENALPNHLKTNHGVSALKCCKCEEYFSFETFRTHAKICHSVEKCSMCLKILNDEEWKNHSCNYRCPECSKTPCKHYKYLKSYMEQILNHEIYTKCAGCDYVCHRKDILLEHVNREHLKSHPFTCDECGQQFYSKVLLTAHINRCHNYLCRYCDSKLKNIKNYRNHVKSCENIKRRFACDGCPASFDYSDSLTNHMKRRHRSKSFPCGLCSKRFLKASNRKEHIAKVHSGLQIKNKVINECVICQEKFNTKAELVQHMKSHESNIAYKCTICNIEYETLKQFAAHNRKHKGPFTTCHVCGKNIREVLLKRHLTTHSNETETCITCGKSFQNITLLKYHQKVHLESVPCPKCKKMINPARLRRHLRGHFEEDQKGIKKQQPNLKCGQCEYRTWNNTLLECHMNRHHLKIKPYVCHICSKDFLGKHLLRKHIETHDMKSVVCMVCLKSFANSTSLKMHLRLHTGEKPFTCEICGDSFRSSSIMNVHKLKKHSEKNNICPLCSNKFHTVRDIRRHVIKVHWKEKNKKFDPRELKGLGKEHYHLFHDGRRVKFADEEVDLYMPR